MNELLGLARRAWKCLLFGVWFSCAHFAKICFYNISFGLGLCWFTFLDQPCASDELLKWGSCRS